MSFKLRLLQGKDLHAADITGASDPYCIIKLPDGTELRSHVVKKTLNPKWNQTFLLSNVNVKDVIELYCWDSDMFVDDFLGQTKFTIESIQSPTWLYLSKQGSVQVLCEPNNESNVENESLTQYRIHYSHVAGYLRALDENKLAIPVSYPVYSISLKNVERIFGNTLYSWNKNYSAAQQIFSATPQGSIQRGIIHTAHAQLCHNGIARTETGLLSNVVDLLDIMKQGKRDGKVQKYTYVLLEKKLRFSETGATFMKDFSSKHALHSDAAERVRYAGEFCVIDGIFIFDNNSGTYAPDSNGLEMLKIVLQENIKDIVVKTFDRSSPELQTCLAQIEQK